MWIHLPSSTCYPSAPVSPDSILDSESRMNALAQSVWWKGKRLRVTSWQLACRRAHWMNALSGQICEPSTASLGVGSWISSLPENANSKPTKGTSGRTHGACFAKLKREGFSSKMFQASLFQTEEPAQERLSWGYSKTWPKTGSMRSGECFRRPKLEQATSGNGSSCWPTATSREAKGGYPVDERTTTQSRLCSTAEQWPTPNAQLMNDGADVENHQARQKRLAEIHSNGKMGPNIREATELWATVRATTGDRSSGDTGSSQRLEESPNPGISDQARQWTEWNQVAPEIDPVFGLPYRESPPSGNGSGLSHIADHDIRQQMPLFACSCFGGNEDVFEDWCDD
jgi:hypothetical protein